VHIPSSVITVETVTDGHRLWTALHIACSVSVSSLSEIAHATGWPEVIIQNLNINCAFEIYYHIVQNVRRTILSGFCGLILICECFSMNCLQSNAMLCRWYKGNVSTKVCPSNISCYMVYPFPFCAIWYTCLHTVMIFIRNHDCEELKTVLVGFVGWVNAWYFPTKSFKQCCLKFCHYNQQKCILGNIWQFWIFYTLRLVK